ncbi:MAG: MGMT family protein [Desulfurococcaceae archaeon]
MLVIEVGGDKAKVREADRRDICEAVYVLVQMIPIGYVTSYGNIARFLGVHPRIVANCLRRNNKLIVVPCHRVVYSTLRLGGYSRINAGFKKRLLLLEGVLFKDDETVSEESFIDLEHLLSNIY